MGKESKDDDNGSSLAGLAHALSEIKPDDTAEPGKLDIQPETISETPKPSTPELPADDEGVAPKD